MKYIFACVILLGSVALFSQSSEQEKKDQIKAIKIGFITEKLDLTPEVSEKFWPIYNQHEKIMDGLWSSARPKVNYDELSEEEASELIDNRLVFEEKMLVENKSYIAELRKVLSDKQIITLMNAERELKRKILRSMKERQGKKGKSRD